MNISPIQLHHLAFRRVHVEVDVAKLDAAVGVDRPSGAWNFDGVTVHTALGMAPADIEGPKSFYVTLKARVDCDSDDSPKPATTFPYVIDVEVGGIVQVNGPLADKPEDQVQELAAINGAAVLWSSIREQVTNITSRMPPGPAVLPAANFLDLRGTRPTPQSTEKT